MFPGWRLVCEWKSCTHRPLSSSLLGLPYRVLSMNHKKELLRGLWVISSVRPNLRAVLKEDACTQRVWVYDLSSSSHSCRGTLVGAPV